MSEASLNAFWGLLLEAPRDVEDYDDRMYHSGAGVWVRYGVKDGESFMEEEADRE